MTFLSKLYLILTSLMILNTIFRIVYHTYDLQLKQLIYKLKISNSDKKIIDVMTASMVKQFYGSSGVVLFVFFTEVIWFFLGFSTFLWLYHIGIFCYNYLVNYLEDRYEPKYWFLLLIKIFYLIIYVTIGGKYLFNF